MRNTVTLLLVGLLISPVTPAQQDVTFTSESTLVVIDVSVKDKSGKVIADLGKSDFTLLEDGKPQTVSVFEFQRLDAGAPTPVLVPAVRPGPLALTAPKPTGAPSTAKPIIRFQDRRLVAMLFDFSAMDIPEQSRAQKAALKFIDEQMKPADLVAIMTVSNAPLKLDQDFTDDKSRLAEVIRKFQIGAGSDLAALGSDGDDTNGQDTGTAFNADETEFNIFNTDRKLVSLESAAKMLAAFPEKKALLYFSSGITQSGFDNQAQLEAAINAAKKANVAFYPIDARGLIATAPAGDASSAASRGTSLFTGAAQQSTHDNRMNSQETLAVLAKDTGGRLYADDNDLSTGMEKARDDLSSYYILGYYSTNSKLDGKYRRVQVKLNGHPEAKLDYRSGYFGEKNFKKFTSTDKENQLQQALMLGDPVTDLTLSAEVNYFRLSRDRYFVPFAVKVPGSEIALAKSKGASQTEFDFIGQVRDDHQKLMSVVRDGIKIKLDGQTAEQLSSHPIAYDTGFTLAPGAYTMKFLARENTTGKMGTWEAKFIIPNLAPDQPTLKTSSVVWSSQREALTDALATADNKKKVLDADPLVAGGQRLIPSITHVFRKDQNLYVYMEVYDPGTGEDQKPAVAATLSFYRGKTKAFESEPVRLDSFLDKRGFTVPIRFQAPLAQLATGRYTAQINLIDETGKRFATPRTDLAILPARGAGLVEPKQ
jgi:VWFA-related protein